MNNSNVTEKMLEIGRKRPSLQYVKTSLLAGTGGGLAILVLALLEGWLSSPFLMAPFGASCVILFALPDSPLAQPRNVIGGHLISSLVGLTISSCVGVHVWSLALAVGLSIAFMQWTRTIHPPAGADPLLIMMTGAPWTYLLFPVGIGAVVLVLAAWTYHRTQGNQYPKHWFTS
ncbi:HPP family protein [Paenibacillus sp. NAIST15-1]|nr:HPP family protein [Paenibacillus sp. NAIST15-1]GAV10954.1 HPP family protein [Paenibacillus sp. NAIST15-1]